MDFEFDFENVNRDFNTFNNFTESDETEWDYLGDDEFYERTKDWDIPYDEIIYGKPWPGHNGFYVDDRAVRPDEFLNHTPEKLVELCENSRCIQNGYD